ncbi:sensor histidine kinase, partial [Candidatus Moduliflexota bacterium]
SIDAFFVAGTVTAILIVIFHEYNKLEREAEESRRAVAALQERDEVSRWLHDDLGSDLFSITLLTEIIQQKQVEGHGSLEYLDWIAESSRSALNNIRSYLNFSQQVGPAADDLVAYMRDYGQVLFQKREIDFHFEARISDRTLPLHPMKSFSVYLIYKEAMTNILKHAGASRVDVTLTGKGGRLHLDISDDGKGFTPGEPVQEGGQYGTRNIARRAMMIGGEATFDSEPGRGTSVKLAVPV